MVPAFGFSVGDFIAAAGLIAKVAKALKDKGGAAGEYQQVQIELEALARSLMYLEALEPTESNGAHVNAIRGMALTCRIPLQDFLAKVEKFEHCMGAFSKVSATSAKAFARKSQWAVFMSNEVAKLRTVIGAKVLSINLLLATHTSESISRVEAQARKSHATLMASILDLRSKAACANTTLQATQSTVNNIAKAQAKQSRYFKKAREDDSETLRNVSKTAAATNVALMTFRDIGAQILQVISDMPQQIRDTLEQVVKSNLEMYAMLRTIHNSMVRSPTIDQADIFILEDALGRPHKLPYEFFRHLEVFEAYLATKFHDFPGESQVLAKQYSIMDIRRGVDPISGSDWSRVVFPGANLVMSVIVEAAVANKITADKCPRMSCAGKGTVQQGQKSFMICDHCGMQFLQFGSGAQHIVSSRTTPAKLAKRTSMTKLSQGRQVKTTSTTSDPSSHSLPKDTSHAGKASNFWADVQDIDKTRHELDVFRRVHISPSSKFDSIQNSDTSFYEPFDIRHVKEKFPYIEEFQAMRLGKAITRRRHYLAYTRHMSEAFTPFVDNGSQDSQEERLVDNGSQESQRERKRYANSDQSYGKLSLTSLHRHSSVSSFPFRPPRPARSTMADYAAPRSQELTEIVRKIVPEHGQEPQRKCPICLDVVKFEHPSALERHVFQDLRPYICLHERCKAAEELFDSWNALESHCIVEHEGVIASSGLIHDRSSMEELALFSLPMNDDEKKNDEDEYEFNSFPSASSGWA